MTLQNLVAELDEKKAKANEDVRAEYLMANSQSWNMDDKFILALIGAYEQLKAAALAGSRLAEAVGKMDGGRDSDEEKNFSVFMDAGWKYQRDAALADYFAAINPGTGE